MFPLVLKHKNLSKNHFKISQSHVKFEGKIMKNIINLRVTAGKYFTCDCLFFSYKRNIQGKF
jgi:hypothetical protein